MTYAEAQPDTSARLRGGPEQVAIRTVIMRGGTSKAVFLRAEDVPGNRSTRDRLILALYGSPDPRQIDGLGGADLLTSKCAIVGPSSRPDADVDYTFAQVSITQPVVTYDIICGNISSAVGAYALQEGLVSAPPGAREATVRIHVTNIGKVVTETVPLVDGWPAVEGDAVVEGVPGSGAPLRLDFRETVGSATGALLPTGNPVDRLYLPALGREVEASIVDIANVCVFARAADLGWRGTEGPANVNPAQLTAVDGLRAAAAERLGLPTDQLTPIPVAVAPPQPYTRIDGECAAAGDCDVVARVVGGRPPAFHKAFPGAAGICAAVAVALPGTLANEAARDLGSIVGRSALVRIGHPSGTFDVGVRVDQAGATWQVSEATYVRTARRLMEGTAYVRRAALAAAKDDRQVTTPDTRALVGVGR